MVQNFVRVKDRQRQGDGDRLVEDSYVDLFLTPAVIPYSGPQLAHLLLGQGSAAPLPEWRPNVASVLTWLWHQLADHDRP